MHFEIAKAQHRDLIIGNGIKISRSDRGEE